jgi:hypothetical protein
LSIAVNEGIAPPSNCPDTTDTTVAPVVAAVQNDTTPSLVTDNEVTPAEVQNTASSQVTDKKSTPAEKMKAKQEKLQAQMDEKRKKMMGD